MTVSRIAISTLAGLALVTSISACSNNSDKSEKLGQTAITDITETFEDPTQTAEVDYLTENLPITAGNIITTVNNAREDDDFKGEYSVNGEVYDVGNYYDDLGPTCKTKITRSEFRKDFMERVVPLIDNAKPERVTVTINTKENTATAKVEQLSGKPVLIDFDVDGVSEDLACNANGTAAIKAE